LKALKLACTEHFDWLVKFPEMKRAMAGSYAYFPKALLSLSPSDIMTRLWVFLYTQVQVAQLESSV